MEEIYLYAWKAGLKGTYYCFIEKTIQGEKYTESVNKRGSRSWFGDNAQIQTEQKKIEQPVVTQQLLSWENKRGFGIRASHSATVSACSISYQEAEAHLRATKWDDYVDKLKKGELYGWACPTDPFEKVMCESCQ